MKVLFIVALMATLQQTSVAIAPSTPFQISWDQATPDVGTAMYRWWCEGVILKNFSRAEVTTAPQANADGTTTLTATVPGLALGNHQCFVSAFNAVGESKAPALTIPVGTVPAVPIRIRIVVPGGRM